MIVTVIISTAIGILGAKSMTEAILYSLPFSLRVESNLYAFTADIIVLVIGFEICIRKEKSLKMLFRNGYE